jgi:hypothetical protein
MTCPPAEFGTRSSIISWLLVLLGAGMAARRWRFTSDSAVGVSRSWVGGKAVAHEEQWFRE